MSKFIGVQQQILNSLEKNQLVSAGAGSGKTTVMIQKIADVILKNNVDIDNVLVVTFTVLAAEEMKQRLIQKLKEEAEKDDAKAEQILNVVERIKTASIDTIDGFASKTIKKYFYDLKISPNIEIISDATKDYYLTRAMKQTMDKFSKDLEKVNLMLELFAGNRRNLTTIEDLVIATYQNVINLENPEKFLENSINEYIDSLKSENIINFKICNYVNKVLQAIIENYSTFSVSLQTKLSAFIVELQKFNSCLNFKHNLSLLLNLSIIDFTLKEKKENATLEEVLLQIKKLKTLKTELETNNINLDFEEKNLEIKDYLSIFIEILTKFIENYNNLKQKNNFIDFNDLNRLMLKLLENDKIKQELQHKYQYIFIDEYQDVNPLQNKLINQLVSDTTNVFMVGDVKQSIYGFRGASPEGFLEKYNILKTKKSEGNVFDMNLNFRSNPIILNFINEIFSKLMTEQIADINYKQDCIIEPQREDIVDSKVEISLFSNNEDIECASGIYSVKEDNKQSDAVYSSQAKYVLKLITELIGTEFYDANIKQLRKLSYKDIAILSRSEKDDKAVELVNLLKANAIPLNLTNKLEVNNSDAIKLLISILKCVANIADDVDYLASFMALTNLSVDELVKLRNKEFNLRENFLQSNNKNVILGFSKLKEIKNASYTKSNSALIRFILNEQKLRYYILMQENGLKAINLIEEFLNKISALEDGLNLVEFIDMLESNVSKSFDFNSNDGEDCVTIQTIHKSKGLEYPVVILYNSGKLFSYLNDTNIINFNAEIGLGVDYFDRVNRIKNNSIVKYAINEMNKQKGYKEEMRLLYVALTRAKNKLYILGDCTKKVLVDKEFNNNSFLNMILSCFIDNIHDDVNEFKNCVIKIYENFDFNLNLGVEYSRGVSKINGEFIYQNMDKFKIPFKNSVTSINSKHAEQNQFETKNVLSSQVQYSYDEDKAIIGTEYHKALELLDLQKPYNKNTNFKNVDYSKMEQAYNKLSSLTKNAISIKKEAEFMMYVPYNEVVDSVITDKVLIQGVVDLIIENEDCLDFIDYKFSSLPANVLKQKYSQQLKLYKMAIEKAYNKPVKNMYIYSINTNELV